MTEVGRLQEGVLV